MKAILIDVKNNEVKEVNVDEKEILRDWYKHIGCELVEQAIQINDKGDTIMVDEEGLLSVNNNTRFFNFEGGHQPFAGNGLIVGTNLETGDSVDVTVTVDEVRDKITFLSLNNSQLGNLGWYLANDQ